jgi:cell wall-associated NlpC family hydrolase
VLLIVCCAAPMLMGGHQAGADDVTDLDAKAQQIASRLDDLQGQVAQLGEQFNQSQIRQQQLASEKADIARRRVASRRTVEARRADASRFALAAYVGGNGDDALPLALDGRQWDLTRRNGYAAIEIGDRQQIVDDLVAAERIDADLLDSLHEATEEQQQVAEDLARQQAEASELIAEQEQLQSQVKGDLAKAVARQQAAMAAKAQAEAQARLEAKFGAPPTSDAVTTSVENPSTSTPAGGDGPRATTTVPGTRPTNPGSSTPPTTAPRPTAPPVTTPPITPPPPPSSGGKGQIAANAAISQIGVRYSWGGGNASGPSYGFGEGAGIKGFDCSGLTLYAWAQAGVYLYHSAQMQYDGSRHLAISQLQVGDLVFYGTSSTNISHVGIYIGNGQIVHAPNSRSLVQTGPVYLWNGYYAWVGAGRPG